MNDDWRPVDFLEFSMYEAHHTGIVRRISNTAHKSQYIKLCIKHDDGSGMNVGVDGLICRSSSINRCGNSSH